MIKKLTVIIIQLNVKLEVIRKELVELNGMLDAIHAELIDLNFNLTHYWEDKDND